MRRTASSSDFYINSAIRFSICRPSLDDERNFRHQTFSVSTLSTPLFLLNFPQTIRTCSRVWSTNRSAIMLLSWHKWSQKFGAPLKSQFTCHPFLIFQNYLLNEKWDLELCPHCRIDFMSASNELTSTVSHFFFFFSSSLNRIYYSLFSLLCFPI